MLWLELYRNPLLLIRQNAVICERSLHFRDLKNPDSYAGPDSA